MTINNPMTCGEAADIINKCDEEEILIYMELPNDLKIPIDNYEFFKMLTWKDPDENFPMALIEDSDGNIMLTDSD